jgi:hypothetical protein
VAELRWVVLLKNARGHVVTSASFGTDEEALVYRKQAELTAKEIGGTVEVVPPEEKGD